MRVNQYIKLLTMPQVSDVAPFRINVANTGNTTLLTVLLIDQHNPNCFEFVSALPAPDAVKPPCSPSENRAWTRATDAFGRMVGSRACADIYASSASPRAIYLPLLLKPFPR